MVWKGGNWDLRFLYPYNLWPFRSICAGTRWGLSLEQTLKDSGDWWLRENWRNESLERKRYPSGLGILPQAVEKRISSSGGHSRWSKEVSGDSAGTGRDRYWEITDLCIVLRSGTKGEMLLSGRGTGKRFWERASSLDKRTGNGQWRRNIYIL